MHITHEPVAPVNPSIGRLRPLGINEVRLSDGFWAQRQQTNAAVTLPHIAHWLEREGWIGNFDLAAAGRLPDGRRGREFSDSEVYKFLEAAAWQLGNGPDEWLEATFRSFVERVAAAQEPDGYLNTNVGRPGQPSRWSNLAMGHELYCLGHLFQAAVARKRTAPDSVDGLLGIATRAADLVCDVFAAGGIESVCGHPVVEVGLAELWRVTGERRYLTLARLFIDRRGHGTLPDHESGRAYYQDDVPIREANVFHGHAVRANYLAAGAVDVAVETGDAELLDVLQRQWRRTIARRTYVTGGQGSHFQDESLGEDWELPPDRSYAETCASVASIMVSWRLLLVSGDADYADHIERTLFNVISAAVSLEGNRFFYTNTLHRRVPGSEPDQFQASPRAFSSLRAPWFEVSCCPPNIARTLASLAGFVATVDDEGLQLHQYASATISTALDDGTQIALDIQTDYPDGGLVSIAVRSTAERPWTLTLRVPMWASSATVTFRPVNGEPETTTPSGRVVSLTRAFVPGDRIELRLPLEPEFVHPDPRIDAVRGCVAVQRGPVVYCVQSVAHETDTFDLDDFIVDTGTPPSYEDQKVWVNAAHPIEAERPWPYTAEATSRVRRDSYPVALIPYHDWGQAGLCTMRVWMAAV